MAKDEELDYASTSPFLTTPPETKPQDEEDLPTLKRVQKMIDEKIAYYGSIAALTIDEDMFTVKEQLALNKMRIADLNEWRAVVDTTINNIKEKYNG